MTDEDYWDRIAEMREAFLATWDRMRQHRIDLLTLADDAMMLEAMIERQEVKYLN